MQPAGSQEISLKKLQALNWAVLAAMTAAGWLAYSPEVAKAIFIGGAVASLSFSCLKKDLSRLLGGPLQAAKVRFFLKYYARLSVLVAILFFLVKFGRVHILGLLMGLSTVFVAIVITVAAEAKKLYFNVREAS